MDRLTALKTIAREAAAGELSFPTHAQLALKIHSALNDPNCAVDQAARLIQAEPLLSARAVAMANSVIYNPSGREVSDVRSAVNRLGFTTLRSLAMALVTRQMAGASTGPAQQTAAAKLWSRTAHIAALARVLAQRVTQQDSETALFAGLVHDIGGFYLISRAASYPALLKIEAPLAVELAEGDGGDSDDADTDVQIERDLGRAVLRQLAVPGAVIEGIGDYWRGMLSLPPVTLGDTLLLADLLAPVPSPLRWSDPELSSAQRAASIDMLVEGDTLQEILRESAADVESLTASLSF
jgi:HD-like signal output (HDOD) protein